MASWFFITKNTEANKKRFSHLFILHIFTIHITSSFSVYFWSHRFSLEWNCIVKKVILNAHLHSDKYPSEDQSEQPSYVKA